MHPRHRIRTEGSRVRCDGPSRRDFLKVGVLAGLGAGEWNLLQAMAGPRTTTSGLLTAEPRARSVINIFLPGGFAHQDTWDPKPYAPLEYRGQLATVDTAIPGVRFGSHLGRTARIADRLTVIRSFTHCDAAHERGVHNILTGYRPSAALVYPSIGSVVAHEHGPRADLPAYVCVPGMPDVTAGTGYLSASYAPFAIGSDPANNGYRVRDLAPPGGIDEPRVTRRRRMLDAVNEHFRSRESSDALDAMDTFYGRAWSMLASESAREAFNLDAEPDPLKDEYGRNQAGMRLLLCRRLVESGVRYVTTTYGGWDHHEKIGDRMREQVPPFDQAFATLILDLERRGLLDSTLVLVTTEFGRTPKLNPEGGRDHWPGVFSVVMAGGGVKAGHVHGASDTTATAVDSDPVTPEDMARTIFTLLGVDPDRVLIGPGDRPVSVVKGGRLLDGILA